MAAVPEQVNSAAQNTGLATVAASLPSAPAAGSVLILIVAADDYDDGLPGGMADGDGWQLLSGQETFLGHYVWACTASGSGTSVDYTIGSAAPSCWILAEISGVTLTDVVAFGQFAQSSGNTYTTASTGTLTAGDWYLIASIGGSLSTGSLTLSTWLNSFTERADIGTTLASGTRDVAGYADRSVTADGSTAYSSGATYSSTAQSRTGIIVALKVAAGGTPGTITTVAGNATAAGGTGALTGAATMSTVAGTATAAGGTGAMAGAATLATVAGAATASGGSSTLTGAATLTTAAGAVIAAGGTGSLTGAATFATTTGAAAAAGGTGTMTGGTPSTITTLAGQATASGGIGAMTGAATLATTVSAATAAGGTGSLVGNSAIITSTGTATAAGGTGTLTAAAVLVTVVGTALAAGGVGVFIAASAAARGTPVLRDVSTVTERRTSTITTPARGGVSAR